MREVIVTVAAIALLVLAMSATDIADWLAKRRKRREKEVSNGKNTEA